MANNDRQKRQKKLTKLVRELQMARDLQDKLLQRERDRKASLENLASDEQLAKRNQWPMISRRIRRTRRWQKKVDRMQRFDEQSFLARAFWPVAILVGVGAYYDPATMLATLQTATEALGAFGDWLVEFYEMNMGA